MSSTQNILDDIIRIMTPPANAPISVVFEHYNKSVQFLDSEISKAFEMGKASGIKEEKNRQIKKQQNQN